MAKTYEPITTQTLGSNTVEVTFTGIPSTYTDLVLVMQTKCTSSNGDFGIRFNTDSGTNYSRTQLTGDGSSASSVRTTSDNVIYTAQVSFSNFGTQIIQLSNYANTSIYKTILYRGVAADTVAAAGVGLWRNTGAITSIGLSNYNGARSYATGSTFTLYGIKAA